MTELQLRPAAEIPPDIAASTLNQRERFAAVYLLLEAAVDARTFPGAGFGVYLDGKVVALDGVGRYTYATDSPAVLATTIYDLASVTKVVATASVAMLLHDQGHLELDQPLGDILPGFVIGLPRQRCDVTFRRLLAHSSGLPAYARLFEQRRTPEDLLNACLSMPLEARPGARAEYSDIGFILLGKALERLCGEPLDIVCQREIFIPLGMNSTRYKPPASWRKLIPPTVDDGAFRHRVIQGEVHDENCSVLGGVSGHAGLFSSPLDLLRFAKCILAGGSIAAEPRLFTDATIAAFSQRQPPQPGSSRALGWDTPSGESSSGHHFSHSSIGHLGYTGTSLWIDPERQLAVTLLTNRTWPDGSNQAIRNVRPAFHDAVFDAIAR